MSFILSFDFTHTSEYGILIIKDAIVMRHEITNIRCNHLVHTTTESIYAVKLAQGDHLLIKTLITYLDMGVSYFYFDDGKEKEIETVHLLYKEPYICTKDCLNDRDPLLLLPSY